MSYTLAISAFLLSVASGAQARDQIRIVGSSTVYPFATVVAEEFGNSTKFKTPIIESTGSGGGLKLFCAGVGDAHPDITNASRRIKSSEVDLCASNGIANITEVKIGYDGIVLANSVSAKPFALTRQQIFLALAKDVLAPNGDLIPNPNKTWKDVDASLPDVKIEVLGPPPTSGTRDAFNELALEGGCKSFPALAALKKADKNQHKKVCRSVREDGAYVEAGENDNLIVQKLGANPDALGVFGFSFLDQNRDKVQGSTVDGVGPTFEAISDGSYPVSRSLYFYVKNAHVGKVVGIQEYVNAFTSEKAIGDYGYLADRGLIPAPEEERKDVRTSAAQLKPLMLGAAK
ncbi:MAG: PstS family phosphate ABC transporter substrate-binding protein [Deltaproteobacteria bacterium]|nr:PstS family phosphate ABC transporter substrate-binding protein [Deltaproteobacteria bacterium]